MDIDLSKLNEVDLKNIGSLPPLMRAALIGALCVGVLLAGYFIHIQGLRTKLAAAQQIELSLKGDFEEKQNKAANLSAYQNQMKDMQESFGTMLRQLPSKTEVADLLVDITQTGLASGLTFDLFKPEKETPLEFYSEFPITVQVSGTYHDFGGFVSGVAALPRIVTLHNIDISADQKTGKAPLVMKATAKTYRYLDDEEIAAVAAERAKSKKKGK